eukprot:SAG31_NODE_2079_length_6498_cov_3.416159_5_plen_170_part_00
MTVFMRLCRMASKQSLLGVTLIGRFHNANRELTGTLTDGLREGLAGAAAGEAFAVGIRRHCQVQIQQFAEYEGQPDEKWGERPNQMIRAAARGAMLRAHGKRVTFSVEYTKQRRFPVEEKEVVAWEFKEISAAHSIDFKVEFVEPGTVFFCLAFSLLCVLFRRHLTDLF